MLIAAKQGFTSSDTPSKRRRRRSNVHKTGRFRHQLTCATINQAFGLTGSSRQQHRPQGGDKCGGLRTSVPSASLVSSQEALPTPPGWGPSMRDDTGVKLTKSLASPETRERWPQGVPGLVPKGMAGDSAACTPVQDQCPSSAPAALGAGVQGQGAGSPTGASPA